MSSLFMCRVERFSEEMNQLLEITLRSRLVEKLCVAMYSGIFEEHAEDDEEQVRWEWCVLRVLEGIFVGE